MDFKDFLQLVKKLRAAQKKYFRTRDANVLLYSKELEKEVDRALEELEGGQGELF